MPKFRFRHALVAVILLVAMLVQGTWALAGTTGGLSGTLVDTASGKPVANATVTANSPSQTAKTTTDASGRFNFLALAPDTYVVSATKDGFAPSTVAGVTVFADQQLSISLETHPELKTIAKVQSRAAGNLVKAGTTADVYSVNAATQQVVASSGGGFNLNQAYSAIYAQPGVTSYVGNYGWGQVFYIRGGAYSQTGYEFDGVPVNRAFDNYQANSLSNLGQQELQVYTGGSPSGASSATLGGFINQVIKTGTYPGFGNLKGGIGAPEFYHALTAEAGGANPNRTFSYYVGLNGYNEHYPIDNRFYNGIDYAGHSKYGIIAPSESATLYYPLLGVGGKYGDAGPVDGGVYPFQFGNGPWPACSLTNNGLPAGVADATTGTFGGTCLGYGPFGNGFMSDQYERNTVLNFHFAIPHKHDGGRDDIQLLYDNSMQYGLEASSLVDNGGLGMVNGYLMQFAEDSNPGNPWPGLCGEQNDNSIGCAAGPTPISYADSHIFAPGTGFGEDASKATVLPYYFPSSPTNRVLNTGISPTLRDGNWNDVGIVKLQYTKSMGANAYARAFAYTFYSDWLNSGPTCATSAYLDGLLNGGLCGNTPDYELATHTRGAELQFADQLNPQNLLQFTANYTTAGVTRFNNGSWLADYSGSRAGVTNLTNGDPNNPMCFDYRATVSNPAFDPTLPVSATNPTTIPNPAYGAQASCFSSHTYGTFSHPTRGMSSTPCADGTLPATSQACLSGAKWLVTVPGGQGTYNTVKPVFSSFALQDDFKPTDKLDLNIGLRFENYRYDLANLDNPEFNFWFNAGAQVNCYDPGTGLPMLTPLTPGEPVPPAALQTAPNQPCGTAPSGQPGVHPTGGAGAYAGALKYSAAGPATFSHSMVSPRLGLTYSLSADTVLRASAGKYTQPTETAFEQYSDQSGKRAAAFDFAQFWGLGFTTPAHDNPVQYSNNYDFSLEHHFKNTDLTTKISPFYRDTHNEIVEVVLGPGFVGGVNVGHQHSYGVEFALQKGDPSRDGFSGALSYTYTKALLQYGNLPNGTNAIDYLNNYVKEFNKLTKGGGGSPCYDPTSFAADGSNAPSDCSKSTDITNPYYNMSQQGLLARDGWYNSYPDEPPNDPYDQPGTAISPHSFTGWLQYKHGRFAIAPNFELFAGHYYGSPTDTYGVDPRWCTQNESSAVDMQGNPLNIPAADAQNPDFLSCAATGNTTSGYLAIPDPYTGHMDGMAQFQQPWIFNLGALIRYEISPRITANLSLTNLVNTCFGGSKTPWSSTFKPTSNFVCGYDSNSTSYIGPVSGQPGFGGGFFYGNSPSDPVNGTSGYAPAYNYPFAPSANLNPFQAYLEVQIKL